ncbi:hypothetical protein [Sphingomonas oligoaromativorans]|uniref:hypothetical protein n=1 Tax=Sphingomonas oligoaromativorans TaxID=575322 RepID=UPI001421EFE2|nr:hypothetical protein [Sphingomonas oligoaromativorans]NIJ32793.1 hypothetical protein [Sphingomonas oligoaromativorans]
MAVFCGTGRPLGGSWPERRFTAEEVEDARREVQPVLEMHDRALQSAGRQFVETLVGLLSAAFPPSKGTDADAALKLELYVIALQDLPPDLLAQAARTALRRCRFFPTVAELLGAGDADGVERIHADRIKWRNNIARDLGQAVVPVPKLPSAPIANAMDRGAMPEEPWPC